MSDTQGWRRQAPLRHKSFVTVRAEAFGFSAAFADKAQLDKNHRVNFEPPPDIRDRRVSFRFHDRQDDEDSYAVTLDGGQIGKKQPSGGRAVGATALIAKYKWIKEVGLRGEPRYRRFEPKWDSIKRAWVIQLCPAFEEKAADVKDVPSGVSGLYRLLDRDEVVYIGKGAPIRSRLRSHESKGWVFNSIHYSPVEDEAMRTEWESYWHKRHEAENDDRLPRYNIVEAASGADST